MEENSKELQKGHFLLYTFDDTNVQVEVYFKDENIWLSQKLMAELFETTKQNISLHLKNIFTEGELEENAVVKEYLTTGADGKRYKTKFYCLDAIISVGYRVNSAKATQFRIWATQKLKDFIIKGFVLDDERLKNGQYFEKNYFDELIERVREIRTSERNFYQKITDIYTTSVDYDKSAPETQAFFATVQIGGRMCLLQKIIYQPMSYRN